MRTKRLQKSIAADFAVLNVPILGQMKETEQALFVFYVCNSNKGNK